MATPNGPILNVRIPFPVAFSWLIAAVVIVLTAIFYYFAQSAKETLIFFSAGVAAGGAALAAYYAGQILNLYIAQEMQSRVQASALAQVERRALSLRYGARWNHSSMFHARDVCRHIIEKLDAKSVKDINTYLEDDKTRTNVAYLLNFLEEVSMSIECGLVDADLTRSQFEGIVTNVWQILGPWIRERREKRGRDKMWEKVESLYHEWNR